MRQNCTSVEDSLEASVVYVRGQCFEASVVFVFLVFVFLVHG